MSLYNSIEKSIDWFMAEMHHETEPLVRLEFVLNSGKKLISEMFSIAENRQIVCLTVGKDRAFICRKNEREPFLESKSACYFKLLTMKEENDANEGETAWKFEFDLNPWELSYILQKTAFKIKKDLGDDPDWILLYDDDFKYGFNKFKK